MRAFSGCEEMGFSSGAGSSLNNNKKINCEQTLLKQLF